MYRSRTWVIALATSVVAAAGCATASPGANGNKADANEGGDPDARPIGGRIDAMPEPDAAPGTPDAAPPPDAPPPPPDAAPGVSTLSETSSNSITDLNSAACNLNNVSGENSYYRAFRLSDYGIATELDVTRVDVGVEESIPGNGTSQQLSLRLYTYSGTYGQTNLNTAQMSMIAQTAFNVGNINTNENGGGTTVPVSITAAVPAGSILIVEVFIQDATDTGTNSGNQFFFGSNTGGETASGYIRTGADCGITTPTSLASLYSNGSLPAPMTMVMTVTGTHN